MKQDRLNRSGRGAAADPCLVALAQSTAEARPALDPRRRRRAFGWCVIGLVVWGASGAWAGDGLVALQTAAGSCADDSGDRYVDCGNGTVTDNDTGLVWLKNANCIGAAGGGTDPDGQVTWHTAMEFVAGLSDLPGDDPDDCGLEDGSSPGEWRLASKAEWQAMTAEARALGCTEPALTNDNRTDCWDQDCVDLGACSFAGVAHLSPYWTNTTDPELLVPFGEDLRGFPFPAQERFAEGATLLAWPVRGGQ